jgi:hypothetical protein
MVEADLSSYHLSPHDITGEHSPRKCRVHPLITKPPEVEVSVVQYSAQAWEDLQIKVLAGNKGRPADNLIRIAWCSGRRER